MAYYRSLSPSSGRHYSGPRASTGMVQLDPYDSRGSRYEYDGYPSDTGYTSAYRYPSRRSTVEARPVASQKIHNSANGAKKRTEYTIQPHSRSRSSTTSAMEHNNIPTRLSVTSSRLRPAISSGHGSNPSPISSDSGQYLIPSSSHGHHRRVYSTDYASDTGRQGLHGGTNRPSSRPSYRVHGGKPRHYTGPSEGDGIDAYDAYSYTTPSEQFYRDYPVQPRRSTRASGDRPLSMTVMDQDPRLFRPVSRNRIHGPPPTSRAFDKLDSFDREGRPRSARPEDQHRSGSKSRAFDRALVAVSHGSDDDYDSLSDGGHHRRRRPRRSHRDSDGHHRQSRSHRSHNSESDNKALVGLGTAALGAGYSDMSDYDHSSGRRHHRRRRDLDRDFDASASTSRELLEDGTERKQLYLESGDYRPRSRHSHRRHTGSSDGFTDDEDLREYKRQPSADPSRRHHSSADTSEDDRSGGRHHRDRSHRSSSRRLLDDRSYHSSPSRQSHSHESRDELRTPITVEPPATKTPEVPPKGILKAPRASFPEEKNPVREGVAPLKDATKKGIPPGARWTKIDRRLVNPEALDMGNERYEERSDYVIVLRVLSKEEIQAYAVKTKEIRGKL